MTDQDVHDLYRAAMEADDAFRAALVVCYGERGAADARYRTTWPDPACRAAWQRAADTMQVYLDACRNRAEFTC